MIDTLTLALMLCVLLVMARLVAGRWFNAQTALSLPWLLSLVLVLYRFSSFIPISKGACAWIALANGCFFMGYATTQIFTRCRTSQHQAVRHWHVRQSVHVVSDWTMKRLFVGLGLIGLVGAGIFFAQGRGSASLTLAGLGTQRGLVAQSVDNISIVGRVLAGFLYPATLLGGFYLVRCQRPSLIALALPWVGVGLVALTLSGRGNVIICCLLFLYTAFAGAQTSGTARRSRLRRALLVTAVLLFLFFAYSSLIVRSRGTSNTMNALYNYIAGPPVAFSAWLQENTVRVVGYDGVRGLLRLAPASELARLLGGVPPAPLEQIVVWVPFPFNVYTALSTYLLSIGGLGLVVLFWVLGCASAWLDCHASAAAFGLAVGVLYSYLSYTLFVDMAVFSLGWWLSAVFVGWWGFNMPIGESARRRAETTMLLRDSVPGS